MKKRRAGFAIGSAVALALTSVLAFGAPANAAITQCSSNRACAWFNENYSGTFGQWSSSQSNLTSSGFNDVISSVLNKRSHTIGWWTDAGYSGGVMTYGPGAGGYTYWPDWRNDSYSSLYFYAS